MGASFKPRDGPQYAQASLPALPSYAQSDSQLTSHLASRFHASLPTAKLSSHGIISLNTYKSSARGQYGGKEESAMAAMEELAARAITRLCSRGENQSVVFLGESGSGKTTLRSHFLSSVLSRSSTPLSTKLSYAAFVFDSLTTTKSITTPTASKSGLFYELQYDPSSTLIGGKILDHRLETGRLSSVPTGERSYHILYYMLAGTTEAEKNHLGLESSTGTLVDKTRSGAQKRWRYLGHPTQLKVGINDAEGFHQFKHALRNLEFPRNEVAEICQILATILHIGQLEFTTSHNTTTTADDSGGFSHEGAETVTIVKNREILSIIAAFLGVAAQDLEICLANKSKIVQRERVTVMLEPRGARENADELAQTLYSLLVTYIVEHINQRLCADEEAIVNTISIVDFPGFVQTNASGSTLDRLLNNSAAESFYNLALQSFFEHPAETFEAEDINVPQSSYYDNTEVVKCLLKSGNGLLSILDDQMRREKTDLQFLEAIRKRFEHKSTAITIDNPTTQLPGSNFISENTNASFALRHYAGEVDYPVNGLLEQNGEAISNDLMNLVHSTRSSFIQLLFCQEALQTVFHPVEKATVMQATLSSKPLRKPSIARRGTNKPVRMSTRRLKESTISAPEQDLLTSTSRPIPSGAAAGFLSSLATINKALSAAGNNRYFVYCIKPNGRRIANQFDSKCVRNQLQTFGIAEISQRLKTIDFSVFLPFGEFLGLSESADLFIGSEKEKAENILDSKHWPENEFKVGGTGVLLSEKCWAQLIGTHEQVFPGNYTGSRQGGLQTSRGSPEGSYRPNESRVNLLYNEKAVGYHEIREIDAKSDADASAFIAGDMFRNFETRAELAEKGNERRMEEVDDILVTGSRKRWLGLVWLLTWWVPDILIRTLGRMPRKDVRTAWREKLAINLLIWLSCGMVIFFIVIFPNLICPHEYVYTNDELTSYNGQTGNERYVAIRGVVFDLGTFMQSHYPSIIPDSYMDKFSGKDATNLFPVQVSAMCQGATGTIDKAVQYSYQTANYSQQTTLTTATALYAKYHDFRWAAGVNNYRPTWFTEQMLYLEKFYWKGTIGYPPTYLKKLASKDTYIANIGKRVYDFTQYVQGSAPPQYPSGYNRSELLPNSDFMDSRVVNLFTQHAGQDLTQYWLDLDLDDDLRSRMSICLDNLFYVGNVDTRGSIKCQFAQYFLLAVSGVLAAVICFKFVAALQFSRKAIPENLDKFVICTVPAYTEDEESLRRAIDSAARMKYDDKRKLLVIVCDGMIIGRGNDKPTPRIVLDILGVPATVDPEPLSFESLGEGMKQHNMGKVYSGLYESQGHIVPFLVIVKVGKPSEVSKPGNRGKRDSQMILMRFLNRVHYNLPMTPLELEMHHQIRNIIGVNPTLYEFIFQIDADTDVAPDSATRMVAAFLNDTRLIGVCGETALSNAKDSMVTMMQVYEYFISHNLTKAFESLFGSVTCLPGCFSMYRIRSADSGKPLFVSHDIVRDYSEIRVDTLHMKNLLHLGEDRYLTTLLLKYHGKYKTKFLSRARAYTIAPDSWSIFLSQRRRWINSTVHNLIELIPLSNLCGFFLFSMRFVVMLDLLSTLVQPVIVGYIIYLIYLVINSPSTIVPVTAFVMLGAIYGLQAIIFILRRKWDMLGWLLLYVLATPVFACMLPLYAFWNMDEFSWGSTRLVEGEAGRQVVVSDEGKFDPASIPKKRWSDYQAELWEAQSRHEVMSQRHGATSTIGDDDARSVISYATKSASGLGGHGVARSEYTPHSRPVSTPLDRSSSALSLLHHSGGRGLSPSPLRSSSPQTHLEPNTTQSHQNLEPTDDSLLSEIRLILSSGEMWNLTKRDVRMELERKFGCRLEGVKKAYVSSAVEAVLAGRL